MKSKRMKSYFKQIKEKEFNEVDYQVEFINNTSPFSSHPQILQFQKDQTLIF